MLYTYDQIKVVHLEMTDACNASCPMCARNINGGEDNPQLPNTELSIDDIKSIFEPSFIAQLDRMYMCGNYGDPIAAKHTLEAFEYFRSNSNTINLSMHTNGSAKRPEWWAELARVIGRKGHVVFSIDGLEDTNHLYRQNTIWSKIMENAEAFIRAGGRARWDYIVFAHNEHQVEEAELLANKIVCFNAIYAPAMGEDGAAGCEDLIGFEMIKDQIDIEFFVEPVSKEPVKSPYQRSTWGREFRDHAIS